MHCSPQRYRNCKYIPSVILILNFFVDHWFLNVFAISICSRPKWLFSQFNLLHIGFSDKPNPRFFTQQNKIHLCWRWNGRLLPHFESGGMWFCDAKEELSPLETDLQWSKTSWCKSSWLEQWGRVGDHTTQPYQQIDSNHIASSTQGEAHITTSLTILVPTFSPVCIAIIGWIQCLGNSIQPALFLLKTKRIKWYWWADTDRWMSWQGSLELVTR